MKLCTLFLFLLSIAPATIIGQDVHWSQYNHNPIYYNPAQAGNIATDVRFTANYRDQWRSVTKPFSTIAVAADAKLLKYKTIGVAANFFHDVAGDGSYRTMQTMLALSHNSTLSPKMNLRFGLQFGINHRSIDYSALNFDAQYVFSSFNVANPTNENFGNGKHTSLLLSSGALLNYQIDKKTKLETGLSFFNLNRPNQSINSSVQKRDIRSVIQAKLERKLTPDLFLLPSFQVNAQGKYHSVIIGSDLKYELINRNGNYRAVFGGIWTRVKDATWITLGIQNQLTFVGISYDVNYSKLVPASRIRGGLEIAIRHELIRFKPKKVTHRVCPDYI
jgi:type IX secretion system PorP/SprF family membrane protein